MTGIKVNILEFADESQPGWVLCSFTDAFGTEHLFQEKIPIVTSEYLDENSSYPTTGVIAGKVVKETINAKNETIVTIDFTSPWAISNDKGMYVFEMHKRDIIEF